MLAACRLSPRKALVLLALAVLARALVPSGWMPVAHAGELKVMLCSGSGPVAVTLELGKNAAPQAPRDPCPFAVAASDAADTPPPLDLAALPRWGDAPAFTQPHAARLVAWRAARPPARGPPAFA